MKRFSLATLLVLAVVAALTIALWTTRSELSEKKAELMKLRKELRLLDPSQPELMRAIEVPSFGRNQWRWRVDLPDDQTFVLRWTFDGIPISNGFPPNLNSRLNGGNFVPPELPSEEFMLLVAAFEENGDWMLGVKVQSEAQGQVMSFSSPMQANDASWLARRGGNSISQFAGKFETAAHPVDSPFVLLRYRKGTSPASGVTAMDPNPTDGLLIWIEQAPESN